MDEQEQLDPPYIKAEIRVDECAREVIKTTPLFMDINNSIYIRPDAISEITCLLRLQQCKSFGIVPFHGYFINDETHSIGVKLKKLVPFAYDQSFVCLKRVRQLVMAVHSMMQAGVMHRDLKIDNIMVDEDFDEIRIIDFGLARLDPYKTMIYSDEIYTLGYRAPELILGSRYFDTEKAEVWALGVCIANMMLGTFNVFCGMSSFHSLDRILEYLRIPLNTLIKIFSGNDNIEFYALQWIEVYGPLQDYSFPKEENKDLLKMISNKYGDSAREFVALALDPNPDTRATMTALVSHPFFTSLLVDTYKPIGGCPTITEIDQSQFTIRRDLCYTCSGITSRNAMLKAELICRFLYSQSNIAISYPIILAISALVAEIEDDFLVLSSFTVSGMYRAIPACDVLLRILKNPELFTILTSKYEVKKN